MLIKPKTKKILKSEKGDAIILLSILVTGIVILITVIAVENLKKSIGIQAVQKKSLDSLYKAEEGIEFSLYANKEKSLNTNDNGLPFTISVWENDNKEGGDEAVKKLMEPTSGRNIIITSESGSNQNNNDNDDSLKRTVFANLPSKYYDQVSLWNANEECGQQNVSCTITRNNNDFESNHAYNIFLTSSDFQRDDWNADNTMYRFVFKCGDSQFSQGGQTIKGCEIRDLKVGVDCNLDQCPAAGCSSLTSVNFANGRNDMYGNVVISDWFVPKDSSNNVVELKNRKVVVQFNMVNGYAEEVSGLTSEPNAIKMCKQKDDGSWQAFNDRTGGASSLEFKKVSPGN